MTEGTKSYLFGCHQFLLHPLWVLMAWKLEYKAWPCWWELICILLHDVGICGRQYMSNDKAKEGHWELGAALSSKIIMYLTPRRKRLTLSPTPYWYRARKLIAGHCPNESHLPKSKLFIPDKRSFLVAPIWWEWWNYWVEGFKTTNPIQWRKQVRENLKRKDPMGSHELYLYNLYKHTQNENKRELLDEKDNT